MFHASQTMHMYTNSGHWVIGKRPIWLAYFMTYCPGIGFNHTELHQQWQCS